MERRKIIKFGLMGILGLTLSTPVFGDDVEVIYRIKSDGNKKFGVIHGSKLPQATIDMLEEAEFELVTVIEFTRNYPNIESIEYVKTECDVTEACASTFVIDITPKEK